MSPRRRLAHSIAGFIAIFGLFAGPWPGIARRASGAFTAIASTVAAPLLSTAKVHVAFARAPESATDGDWDSVILLKKAGAAQPFDGAAVDVRRVWYLPIAVFLALSLAFPWWGWRRLALVLPAGILILQVPPMLPVLSFLVQSRVIDLGVTAHTALDIAYRALVAPLGMAYALPAFIWIGMVSLMGHLPVPPSAAPADCTGRTTASATSCRGSRYRDRGTPLARR
jgi:hypothetical protein